MKIPKKISSLLEKRVKLAKQLQKLNWELEEWIESHGGNLTDGDLMCGINTHVAIYEEPDEAKDAVENYIIEKM